MSDFPQLTLRLKQNMVGEEWDIIESEDQSISLWFDVGDVGPGLLRLFAAAPDLLAACEAALERRDECRWCASDDWRDSDGDCYHHGKVRAAIAKARGK